MFTHRFLRLVESLKKVGISPSKLLKDKFLQFQRQPLHQTTSKKFE